MDRTSFIQSIRLRNLLSYGPDAPALELRPLNVLIGPNASGKSNLIVALSLLAAAPGNLQAPIRQGGGISEWLWKGEESTSDARLDVAFGFPAESDSLLYRLSFSETGGRFSLLDESVESLGAGSENPTPLYGYRNGNPVISTRTVGSEGAEDSERTERTLRPEDVRPDQSILSQRRDPDIYPELTGLSRRLESIRFFRNGILGSVAPFREAKWADLPIDPLLEGGRDLGVRRLKLGEGLGIGGAVGAVGPVMWNLGRNLQHFLKTKRRFLGHMQRFCKRVFLGEDIRKPAAPVREAQRTDLPIDFLLEDGGNLGLVLNDLQHRPEIKRHILARMQRFYERISDISTKIHAGTVQIFFHETGLARPVPSARLSDGSLRYLCLLTILCHPEPPPLICMEEPELGLHPDVIPSVADLLVEASARTQLVVTTHSDILVDALTDVPESIVVCEKTEGGTTLRRLESERLDAWLERYRLGELWQMGEIGGNPE